MIILPVINGLLAIEYLTPVLLLAFVFGLLAVILRGCK